MKFKHQLILKGCEKDLLGLGPGILTEVELDISNRTCDLLNQNSPTILFAKHECDVMLIMEHICVKMVKCE